MSEIQYCEDCEHCNFAEHFHDLYKYKKYATCGLAIMNHSIKHVFRDCGNPLPKYDFCTTIRKGPKCKKFKAKHESKD